MSAPKLNRRERQEIAGRYREGETIPMLAEAYGVAWNTIHRALIKERQPRRSITEARQSGRNRNELKPCRECGTGTHPNAVRPLCPPCAKRFCEVCDQQLPADWRSRACSTCRWARRYAKKKPRLCRICGRIGARGTQRDLCAVHVRLYCSLCETHLPPGRVNHHCRACEDEHKQRLYRRAGRICAMCGEREIKVHASRCQHCLHEEYEVHRWAMLHVARPCRQCGEILPKGRRLNRCVSCQRKHNRERKRRRMAIGAHRCAMCAEPLKLKHDTYCPGCHQMLANWRRAWHAGNPIARQLGTVRTQRRWQEKKAA